MRTDSAAGGDRDGAALHVPRPECAEYPERSAGGFFDRVEECFVPYGRSAEAGELSGCDGGVRCGCDWAGEYRSQPELRFGYWEKFDWRVDGVHDCGGGESGCAGY